MPPIKEVIDALLYAVLPAFAVALVIAFLLSLLPGRRVRLLATGLAVLAGLATSNHFRQVFSYQPRHEEPWTVIRLAQDFGQTVSRLPESPPGARPGRYWLTWAILLASVVGLIASEPGLPVIVAWLLRAAIALLAALLLVPLDLSAEYPWFLWLFALAIFATWASNDLVAAAPPRGFVPLAITFAALGAACVLIHAHSAKLTDAATFLAATMSAVAIASHWGNADARGAIPVASVFLPGILLAGYHETFSEVPVWGFLLPALAPLASSLLLLLPLGRRTGWLPWILGMGLVLLLTVVAAILAARAESLDFG